MSDKKIIIDEDWKSQVAAEKDAAEKEAASHPDADTPFTTAESELAESEAMDGDPEMPPASMEMLVTMLATEAMLAMGQIPHPLTGEATARPNQAKYLIDTIAMLKDATKGNIDVQDTNAMGDLLHTLRMSYIAVQK